MSQVPCAQTINATATHSLTKLCDSTVGAVQAVRAAKTSNFLSRNRSTLSVNGLELARLLEAKQDPSHGLAEGQGARSSLPQLLVPIKAWVEATATFSPMSVGIFGWLLRWFRPSRLVALRPVQPNMLSLASANPRAHEGSFCASLSDHSQLI